MLPATEMLDERVLAEVAEGEVPFGPQPGPQYDFLATSADVAVYGGAAGAGKMLAVETPICTPTGWRTMGDLCAGDLVFDETGNVVRVTHAHPIGIPEKAYQLTFDDGAVIIACSEHLWLTFDAKELAALTRRTPKYREKRRAHRPSRVGGRKTERFTKALVERNRKHPPDCKSTPTGTVRTTEEIAKTLRLDNGRVNHAIPVCEALNLAAMPLLVDPYLLGVWLGDGTESQGAITTADKEILTAFKENGYHIVNRKAKFAFGIRGFAKQLEQLGVLGNKHIPDQYLFGSRDQRLALLQGLMDADGYADGSVEFCSTNLRLATGTAFLLRSLGTKVRIAESRALLYGKDCGPRYRLNCGPTYPVFKLERKLQKQSLKRIRRVRRFRYIVACEQVQPTRMRCISVDSPSHLYLAGKDLVPTHNSYALLLDPIRFRSLRGFSAVVFRRTYPQIMAPGGLWDTASRMFEPLDAKPRESTHMDWTFPSGVRVKFAHMQYEDDCTDWDGSQIAYIAFDQLEHFTWKQFWYMLGRNRTDCGIRAYVRATCNPEPDHWLREFMAWWIDEETGYAIPDRSGVIRYFAVIDDVVYWGADPEECVKEVRKHHGDDVADDCEPLSFTFISGTVEDNRILLATNPRYKANLAALPPALKERFRFGNWNAREGPGEFFDPTWFEVVRSAPVLKRAIRYWDRAATEVKPGEQKKASWTAGVLQGRAENGIHFITHVERFQKGPLGVETGIKNTATQDGRLVVVGIEADPGQAGVAEAEGYRRRLGSEGFTVFLNRVREPKAVRARGKVDDLDLMKKGAVRARPYSAYCQAGCVKLLDGPWVKEFLREHKNFDGTRNCVSDQVDAASGGYYMLTSYKPVGVPK